MAVYIIRAGATDKVKIGWAANPSQRLIDLQVAHYAQLRIIREIEGPRTLETWMHHRFSDRWVRGDWHRFHPDMLTIQSPELLPLRRSPPRMNGAVAEIVNRWPDDAAFAEDADVSIGMVRVWRSRDSIPSDRWSRVELAAERRHIAGATASDLARLVDQEAAA